jgi:hypothetical protein
LTKARTATLTAYREVVQAKRAAAGDAKLRPLLGPFAALEASLYDLRGRLKRGAAVSTAIATVNATIVGIENTAHASGIIISERTATPR